MFLQIAAHEYTDVSDLKFVTDRVDFVQS